MSNRMTTRDPTGLDGSIPPPDGEALRQAWASWLRRVQPGLALGVDFLTHLRRTRETEPAARPPRETR